MDSHMDLLGELASDAALERQDFIFQATEQLRKFLDHHRERIGVLGGLTLIDEEPDYLSIAPDLSFRSRSRYLDETSGEWVSETEVIESAAELIEFYNPADMFGDLADAIAEGYPSVAPELAGTAADGGAAEEGEIDADEDDEAEDGDASEDRPTA